MTVVVIGASAGGIDALSTLLAGLPPDFPAPVIIVQHRAPKAGSLLISILARRSRLPVSEAESGGAIVPGTVYIARSDMHLTITNDRHFAYTDGHPIRHVLSSINPLFMSSAAVFGTQAIAVVLSGAGHDGTDGVQAVKAQGGIVIAQDEATAAQFGMPASAIASGVVDFVLPIQDIAPALVDLVAARNVAAASSDAS